VRNIDAVPDTATASNNVAFPHNVNPVPAAIKTTMTIRPHATSRR
jgi:hypothetical protein